MKQVFNKLKNNVWIIIFLLFFPFLCVLNLHTGNNIDNLEFFFELLRLASACIVLMLFIYKKKKPSLMTFMLFVMTSWQLIVSCLTNKKIVVSIYDLAAALAIPLLIEMYLDKPKDIIRALMLSYEVAVYLNFPSFFYYPGRLLEYERTFLLGYYCVVIQFFLPAIGVALVNLKMDGKNIRSYSLMFISFISIILSWSGTNKAMVIASSMLLVLGLILYKFNKKIKLTYLFILVLASSFFVIYIFKPGVFPVVDYFITKILNKSLTFSGRNIIWERATEMVKESPIIGHGFRTSVLTSAGWRAGHAHNAFLDKALVGGFPQLVLFILFNLSLTIKIDKDEYSLIKLVLISLIFGVFITFITESYLNFYRFYSLLYITYYLSDFVKISQINGDEND